jgi:hypothetical protein
VPDGATVAVYDLGGGTFDAAIIRRNGLAFEIVGRPAGIEALGGLDFDAAVFDFVTDHVDGIDGLDAEDPGVRSHIERLRSECVDAKIALSATTETVIPVILPGRSSQVRLTRTEFEERIRPLLSATIDSLRSALHRADIVPDQLDSVLLVGGSSRIPLIGQMVTSELGRPVAVDSDPKHGIARGAAHHAARRIGIADDADVPPPTPVAVPIMVAEPAPPAPPPTAPPVTPAPPPATPPVPTHAPVEADVVELTDRARTPKRLPYIIGGVVAAVLLVVVAVVIVGGGDDAEPIDQAGQPPATTPPESVGFSVADASAALTSRFGVDPINPDYDVSDCDQDIEIPTEVRVPFDFSPAAGIYIFSSDDAAAAYLANELAKDGRTCRLPELDRRFSLEVQAVDPDTIDKLSTEEGSTASTQIRMTRTDNAVVFAVEQSPGDDLAAITADMIAALDD